MSRGFLDRRTIFEFGFIRASLVVIDASAGIIRLRISGISFLPRGQHGNGFLKPMTNDQTVCVRLGDFCAVPLLVDQHSVELKLDPGNLTRLGQRK